MRYLVVDDEVAICQGTARRLQRFLPQDSSVQCAFSGEEAIEKIKAQPPDILITDIRMGSMDGLALIEQARAVRPEMACIIITAFDNFHYAQQAIKLEVKDFLVKPYSESDLKAAVERVTLGMEKTRSQNHDLLERKLYMQLTDGGPLEPGIFTRSGLPEPPDKVRIVVWNTRMEKIPAWTGSWHFADARYGYQLISDERDCLLEWMEQVTQPDVRFGISSAGDDLGTLWHQAQRALEITSFENMPRWVFFQDVLLNERGLGQSYMALWTMNYIAEHVGQPISMEEVCTHLHLNYSYFSRQFKQQIGVSFSEYLLKCQMQWALEHLQKGMRVNEAADALGYGSVESFGKAFSRIFGSTPRNYLNQQRDAKKTPAKKETHRM